MKAVLKVLLVFIFLSCFLLLPGQKSHYFSPPEGKFSVNFPEGYTIAREETELAHTTKAECYTDNEYYLASYTVLPAELDKSARMAELTLEFFQETINATQLSKKAWKINGYEGLLACLIMTSENITIEYRVLVIGNLLYQLAYIAKEPDFSTDNALTFINSFELFKPPAQASLHTPIP